MPVTWLREPHAEKTQFFAAIADQAGGGHGVATWPMRLRGYPETAQRAASCLARAKKQPKGALARATKLAFLKGRYNWARHYFETHPGQIALCWQGLTGTRRAFMEGARDAGAARLFAELAPLPGFKTLDPRGVNFEGSVPRDRGFYSDVAPDQTLLDAIKEQLVARPSRRSDVRQSDTLPPDTGPYLFVPLQVPDDSQLMLFAGWVKSATGFVAALAQASHHLPEGWHLRLKEHPSARIPLTAHIKDAIAAGARMRLDNDTDSFAQLQNSKAVLTVNSSMGLQAMFFDKPVIATGDCFYAIDGICQHADTAEKLARACAAPAPFDAALRARFLTWIAQDYLVGMTDQGYDPLAIKRQIKGAG